MPYQRLPVLIYTLYVCARRFFSQFLEICKKLVGHPGGSAVCRIVSEWRASLLRSGELRNRLGQPDSPIEPIDQPIHPFRYVGTRREIIFRRVIGGPIRRNVNYSRRGEYF